MGALDAVGVTVGALLLRGGPHGGVRTCHTPTFHLPCFPPGQKYGDMPFQDGLFFRLGKKRSFQLSVLFFARKKYVLPFAFSPPGKNKNMSGSDRFPLKTNRGNTTYSSANGCYLVTGWWRLPCSSSQAAVSFE